MTVRVAILAKAPIPGFAKTRLIPRLGADGAAALQRWLLRRTVATALAAGVGPVSLWATPDAAHADVLACAAPGRLDLRVQPDGDLGARMQAALDADAAATLVVGTDCPALDAATLHRAARALAAGDDAVLGPAEDGGYVLLGLARRRAAAHAALFEGITWGTPTVLATTRRRLAAAGLVWSELPALWDVDTAEDYDRLRAAFPDAGAPDAEAMR